MGCQSLASGADVGGEVILAALDTILCKAIELKASDVHILIGMPPMIRLFGEITTIPDMEPIDKQSAQKIISEIMTTDQRIEFEVHREVDFCYEIQDVSRFRTNVYLEERGIAGALRIIPSEIVSVEEIGVSEAIMGLTRLRNGLVLVTGPAGCGKSTTLAALVNLVNRERGEHIITIEDPIEFVHKNIKSQVNQRQVGIHTRSFAAALRASLRETPMSFWLARCATLKLFLWPSQLPRPGTSCSALCTH